MQNDHALQLRFGKHDCNIFWRLDFGKRVGVPAGAVMRLFGRACVQQSFPRRPRLGFGNRAGVPAGAVMRLFGRACVQQSFPRRSLPVIICMRLADPSGSLRPLVVRNGIRQPRWGTRWRERTAIWPRLRAAEFSAPATWLVGWPPGWLAGKFDNA